MTFRVLVTNDDGIDAAGLKVAETIAWNIAGKRGNVITVAPSIDQSGVGHSISYLRPSLISKLSKSRFTVEGTPADCVLAGIYYIMKKAKPNLIISGVNNGHNIAEDILYSGTVGAAMEGSLHGIKSIAISQCYSKETLSYENKFEAAEQMGPDLCKQLLNQGDWKSEPHNNFYNINFPATKVSKIKGIRVCPPGRRKSGSFSMKSMLSPNGRTFLMVNHQPNKNNNERITDGTDITKLKQNFITLTPLKPNLTNHSSIKSLETLFNNDFKSKKT